MKKILVFGTGGAAEKLIANAGEIFDIVGFADNNPKKHNTLFHGRRVYAPSDIRDLPWEDIIVASMWFGDIRDQLVEQFGISADRIRGIPKIFASAGKRYRPFEDDATRDYAGRILQHVTGFLESRGIPCYVDHGTLLGLVRDHGLMPWDDDIDLSIAATDRERLYACAGELAATLPDADRLRWKTELIHNSLDEVIALFLSFDDPSEKINAFNVGLSFFTFENGLSIEAINWAPQDHYAGGEWIDTPLGRFRAPNRYEDYLALHYGNWRTPVKDMAFSQIDNFKRREAPAHWLAWDPAASPSPEPLLDAQRAAPIHGGHLSILASIPNPVAERPRIPADLDRLDQTLAALAPVLHADMAVVCAADPHDESALVPLLDCIRRSGIADGIHVEMGLDVQPCEGVLAAMDAAGAQRSFHRKALHKKIDPPFFSSGDCTETMRGAIRQFRCRYKKRWVLWDNVLAHCPQALTHHLVGNGEFVRADIVEISPGDPALKSRLLAMFRNRPCADHLACESDDGVWAPYAIYPFTRSQSSTPAGDDAHD